MSSRGDPAAGRTVARPPGGSSGGSRAPFLVDVSNSRSARHDAVRVRHQVYCVERGYEAGTGGVETDAHDAVSRHVVLRDVAGDPVGTTRLVRHSHLGFPMEHACAPGIIDAMGLDRDVTVEVSRFSLSKVRRPPPARRVAPCGWRSSRASSRFAARTGTNTGAR